MKKKVLIFSTAYLPLIGGAEVAVKEITDRVGDYSFDLITAKIERGLASKETIGRVNVYRVGLGFKIDKWLLPILGLFKAIKLQRQNKYNFIWSIMASYGGVTALGFKYIFRRVPYLLTLQEGDEEEGIIKKVKWVYPIWKKIFKKADQIQVISSYLEDFAKRQGAKEVIEIISNGVDVEKFKDQGEGEKIRSELGIGKREKVVITVSRLVEKNGVDILIKAMKEVKAKLIIVGEGEDRVKLEELVKKEKLEDKVVLVGEVKMDEVPKYLWASDVFCRPSRSEGFGNVFVEAMAGGVPVVATAVGGITDFLKDGENGLVSKSDKPEQIAEKINMILNNTRLRRKLIQNGILMVNDYDWKKIAKKMEEIFGRMDRQKKVLIAAGIWPPEVGGPATYALNIGNTLKAKGVEVTALAYGEGGSKKENFKVKLVSKKWPKGIRHLVYLLKLLWLARKVDVLYAMDVTAAGVPATIVTMIFRPKFLIRIGGDLLWERAVEKKKFKGTMDTFYKTGQYRRFKFKFRIIKWVVQRADRIIVPAGVIKKINNYYYKTKEVQIIPNVFERTVQKSEVKVNKNEFRILYAGRLIKYKNLDMLIRVLKILKEKQKKIRLTIVGDGPEKEKLEIQIKRLGMEKIIEMKPKVSGEELKKIIAGVQMGISIAWTEYNPNFILECLAGGKPVLLSEENGLSVKLPEEFMTNPFNFEELKEKIVGIVDDYEAKKERAERIGFNFSYEDSVKMLKIL